MQARVNQGDALTMASPSGLPATKVLGVPVSLVNMDLAVNTILGWVRDRKSHFICVRDVHGVVRAVEDPDIMALHYKAGMITPDGMPLVWLARWRGHRDVGRVCGADLVDALCEASAKAGVSHYFFGGKPGVAERMAQNLVAKYPGFKVAGLETPPFRAMTAEEDAAVVERIKQSGAGVVWVGISTPKQEFWMRDHVDRLPGATLIGVGAAFDFHSGDVKRAPRWMRKTGFEWLHRLLSEPRRLWRRYLILAPKFVLMQLRQGRNG
ncbi:WecB/TagA/CpsF family glycosyltransferase [Novosphingobium sp. LASN5T]|uniref:WecB/TagA/CpsF family glycosyltransferase n=1 Tax=Novosphingobium sp. LASN5T TaxID=2491021 RepID=UPI000A6419F8|nr:WecB/TagA/CpsF family glycosyltransferase [Novosphingobium sp. LASN5T]RQW45495.1 glycosyltransferase [Novosphingobium sp. LASN5T]